MINYLDGNLITLAKSGEFEVIVQGVNCFCTQKSGLAPQMVDAFGTDKFQYEQLRFKGEISKLGNIEYRLKFLNKDKWEAAPAPTGLFYGEIPKKTLYVVNAYTQYRYGRSHEKGGKSPIDYSAFTLCMTKINHIFAGKHIGLPKIGSGLAGGDWLKLLEIIKTELKDCKVTIVNYKK